MHMVRLARDVGPPAREQELRDFLGSLPLHRRDGRSSRSARCRGGEKARLVLAMLVWQRPNLLLLDEPTNHLDLTTREALSVALNEFEGTVMLVSHDRALLREVCDEFWLVAGGARRAVRRRPRRLPALAARAGEGRGAGGAAEEASAPRRDAEQRPPRRERRGRAGPRVRRAGSRARRPQGRGRWRASSAADAAKPLQKELNRIDNQLGVLFAERDALEAACADADVDADQRAETGKRLKAIGEQIERARGALARAQHATRRDRRIGRLTASPLEGDAMTMKPEKILYTAHATSTGGRDGTSKTDDGMLDVKLPRPRASAATAPPAPTPSSCSPPATRPASSAR